MPMRSREPVDAGSMKISVATVGRRDCAGWPTAELATPRELHKV